MKDDHLPRATEAQDTDKFITSDITPIDPSITVVRTRPEFAPALAALQHICYPTLSDEERFSEAQYRKHLEIFPEGQFTALRDGVPVGGTSTVRMTVQFEQMPSHTFYQDIGGGWLTNHDPAGEWLYGADMMVHPEMRKRGISRQLYAARLALVKRLNLRGQIAAGMVAGYHQYADQMPVKEYVERVATGELTDPTFTSQLRIGFRFVMPLLNYINDPTSGYACAMICWDNPDYQPR